MSKGKLIAVLSVMILLVSLLAVSPRAQAGEPECNFKMPANPDKILAALIERGEISPTASPEAKEAAVQAYLQAKVGGCDPDQAANPLAQKKLNAQETALNLYSGEINGRKIGSETVDVDPSTPQFHPLGGTDQLLLILVDFSDESYTWQPVVGDERTEAGPLHNEIPVPVNDFDLWVEDFSTQHFEDMLFTPGGWQFSDTHPYYPGEQRGSMRDYFLEQSYGKYTVDGQAYGWFTVDKPEAYYGDDHPDSGSDNLLPGTPQTLLADAVDVINAEGAIDWLDYDLSDPYDLDGDDDLDEPDCIIDHPLFIHAGIDQSGGGGAQGDDAIWAHSASTWVNVSDVGNCEWAEEWGGTILYNYTIMPEDGGVGVFAHEFAHDLGLPDEYDTAYTGYGASTAFWTLQSSGSWIGRPAQTQPSGMSIWARYALGWLDENLAVLDLSELGKDPIGLRMEQAEFWGGEGTLNAVRISLPDKYYFVNDPYSGEYEWFGGKADQIDTTLRRTVDLTGKSSAELSFWTWYEIEDYWDFGFVQVSTDGGATWVSLELEGTTYDYDPSAMESIVANLPGFTGSSDGWVQKTFDLSAYAGQSIELQFRYMTDWGTTFAGFYVDDIGVTADGEPVFFDDVEGEDGPWTAWTVDGWTRESGSGYKPHYYIMEWRNLDAELTVDYQENSLVNFDAGLNNAYNYDPFGPDPNQPQYFPYAPGLLLYYRDFTYTDNWTGAHPGGGFLLIVDAHPQPLIRPPYKANYGGLEWDTRVQSYDAAFSLDRAPDITLTRYDNTRTYQGLQAVPNFYDTHSYWSPKAPSASVIVPDYGLLFRVLGQAEDRSAIEIAFGNRHELDEEAYVSATADFFMIFEKLYLPLASK